MERLTKRELVNVGGRQIVLCDHKEEDCNDSCMHRRCKWDEKALRKLKEYEEAEEQGLLLRLPCKIGDTVYTACSWGIESGVVGSIEIIGDMIFVNNPYRAMIGQAHNIFLAKEEAEQVLTRMEKENG